MNRMKRLNKVFNRSLSRSFKWIVVFGIVFILLCTYFFVPRVIVEIQNPVVGFIKRVVDDSGKGNKINPSLKGEKVNWESSDSLTLTAVLNYSQMDKVEDTDVDISKGTVVLLHGIRSSKNQFIEVVDSLGKAGFTSIAVDLRAHGESEGDFCTFGVNEKQDLVALLDALEKKNKLNPPVLLWGQSLGAAVGLQTMAIDDRIKGAVIESTFCDFSSIVHDYFGFHLGVNNEFLSRFMVDRAGSVGGFDPKQASPLTACKSIRAPVLLVHGTQDRRISIDYARQNFKALKSHQKELLEIAGATHLNVWQTGGKEYFKKALAFLSNVKTGSDGK